MALQKDYAGSMALPRFERGVHLSAYTTFRIGGPATLLVTASNIDDVMEAVWKAEGQGLPWQVIGHGSNLLVSDNGFDGAIIVFKSDEIPSVNPDETVAASGGLALRSLIDFMAESGLAGLEDLAGIPGTVGGAICGNAGAYGRAISERLVSLLLLDRTGGMRRVSPEELCFAYRSSALKESNEVVLEATFSTSRCDPTAIRKLIADRLADRRDKHPDPAQVPTAGSYFKNPPGDNGSRIAAGRLLEDAGCKELAIGGVRPWHAHANILVAENGSRARDVRTLAATMANRVEERFGVRLVPEVVYLE